VTALLYGHDTEALSSRLGADRVVSVDDPAFADFTPSVYVDALADSLKADPPRALIFGDTSIGAEVAGALSMRLDLPLVSRCRRLDVSNGDATFVGQICGGKILVEGKLPEPTCLVTMVPGGHRPEDGEAAAAPEVVRVPAPSAPQSRIVFQGYEEPEAGAVDITVPAVLGAVGRGIANEDNIELAEELAELLGGAVCGSRPVVDQGWLPAAQMVGKSGKRVKPDVYLAFGISGAPEHVEGMNDTGLTIAVNTDPEAPIFDIAQYGTDADLLDLLPVLIEKVQEAAG
jgi:electron transfer flavoprotein alpha subunit